MPSQYDPNIKARFVSMDELVEFLRHYDMPFPCGVEIWYGRNLTGWVVDPEPGAKKHLSGEPWPATKAS